MIDVGAIYVADLGDERSHRVLILSNARFSRLSGRALVAPGRDASRLDRLAPWHIPVGEEVFAVELARSVPTTRLLHHSGDAPYDAVASARRALAAIT